MDMVIWKDGDRELKFPRLTDDERNKISRFVHTVPPVGDSCSPMYNLLIRFARETLDATDDSWNIDKFYKLLVSVFGDDVVSRHDDIPHPYKNTYHTHIKVKRPSGYKVVVADEDKVLICMGTYCPWNLVNHKQITNSIEHTIRRIVENPDG